MWDVNQTARTARTARCYIVSELSEILEDSESHVCAFMGNSTI